jgi:hypothetical protein
MEPTQCSETSAFNTQTPGKYPEDNLSLQQHGKSLKTRSARDVSWEQWMLVRRAENLATFLPEPPLTQRAFSGLCIGSFIFLQR